MSRSAEETATLTTIVVAFDGSTAGRRALERAAELAGDDDRVVVVGSVPPTWTGSRLVIDPLEVEERGRRLDEARRVLFRLGLGARTVLARGDLVSAVASVARASGARLIVATARHPLLDRLGLCRTGQALERRAPCPVIVVS